MLPPSPLTWISVAPHGDSKKCQKCSVKSSSTSCPSTSSTWVSAPGHASSNSATASTITRNSSSPMTHGPLTTPHLRSSKNFTTLDGAKLSRTPLTQHVTEIIMLEGTNRVQLTALGWTELHARLLSLARIPQQTSKLLKLPTKL